MADKKPSNKPDHPRGKGEGEKPLGNFLEIPAMHQAEDVEDVVEVVEDDIPVVHPADEADDVLDVVDVVDLSLDEVGRTHKPQTDVSKSKLVEDVTGREPTVLKIYGRRTQVAFPPEEPVAQPPGPAMPIKAAAVPPPLPSSEKIDLAEIGEVLEAEAASNQPLSGDAVRLSEAVLDAEEASGDALKLGEAVLEAEAASNQPFSGDAVRLSEAILDAEAASNQPLSGGAVWVGREVLEAKEASDPRLEPAAAGAPKGLERDTQADIDLDGADVVEMLEAMPSSSKVAEALASLDDEEPIQAKSPAVDDKTIGFTRTDDSGVLPAPTGEEQMDVVVEYEEILVEGESEIDLGKKPNKAERPSGVDIIAEALESGVDLERAKSPTPPSEKKPRIEESDIEFESVLGGTLETSAVDLGAGGQALSLPASPQSEMDVAEDSGELVGEEALLDSDEIDIGGDSEVLVAPRKKPVPLFDAAAEAEESVLEGSTQTDPDELVLSSRKPMPVLGGDVLDEIEEVGDAPAVESEAAAVEQEEKAVPSSLAKRGRDDASGEKPPAKSRSSLFPFLLGGLFATVVVGGGAGAVWYLQPDLIPESPNAIRKPIPKIVGPGVIPQVKINKAQEARELIDKGQHADALALVKGSTEGDELAMLGLATFKTLEADAKGLPLKLDNDKVKEALKQIDDGGAKGVADDLRANLKLQERLAETVAVAAKAEGEAKKLVDLQALLAAANVPAETDKLNAFVQDYKAKADAAKAAQDALDRVKVGVAKAGVKEADLLKGVTQLAAQRDGAIKQRDVAAKERDGVASKLGEVTKERDGVTKERDAAAKEVGTLNTAIQSALKELKDGNYLSNDPDPAKQLVEGTRKAREAFQTKFAEALLASEQSPDHRLDTIVRLLADRGFKDAKEFASYQRLIDAVRSKDSRASPETRAKALLAAGLMRRNFEDFSSALPLLAEAAKEATALKEGAAIQTVTAQAILELSDPAAYYLPRADRKLADGQWNNALEELNAGLKAMPNNAALHLRRAEAAFQAGLVLGKLDEAAQKRIRDDAEAARKDPKLAADSFYIVGRLDEQLGMYSKAEENYRQALTLGGPGEQSDRYRIALARMLQREVRPPAGAVEPAPEEMDEEEMADDEGDDTQVAERTIAVDDQPGGGNDPQAAKRLEESIALAKELIKSPNPKTRGDGYVLLGTAQAKQGRRTEGLKTFVKGLELLYPGAATQDLAKIIETHPAFAQEDSAGQPSPLLAEKHFGKGLDFFWVKKYADAEAEFSKALGYFDQDARYHYFLAMARYSQNTADKRNQANYNFEQAARLEANRKPSMREVNSGLERVQGDLRRIIASYREKAL